MTTASKTEKYEWMKNVGVPGIEVLWLQRMDGSDKLKHPVAARRLRKIQEMAFNGLIAASKPVPPFLSLS